MAKNKYHSTGTFLKPVLRHIMISSVVLFFFCLVVVSGGGGYAQLSHSPLTPIPIAVQSIKASPIVYTIPVSTYLVPAPLVFEAPVVVPEPSQIDELPQLKTGIQLWLASATEAITSDAANQATATPPSKPIEPTESEVPRQPLRRAKENKIKRSQVASTLTQPQSSRPVMSSLPRLNIATLPPESESSRVDQIDRVENEPLDLQRLSWPECPLLHRQLKKLAEISVLTQWSLETQRELDLLHATRGFDSVESVSRLAKLRELQTQGIHNAATLMDMQHQTALFKMLSGLKRRLAIWHAVQAIITNEKALTEEKVDPRVIVAGALEGIDERLDGSAEAENWSTYLMLLTLKQYTTVDANLDAAERTEDSQRVLTRLHSNYLTPGQAELLLEEPFVSLEEGLRHWCAEPIDYTRLLMDIERYEAGRFSYQGVPVALSFQAIRWSADEPVAQLGAMLDQYYRGGNIRIRIAENFMNRLLPGPTHQTQEIDDTLAGAKITGTSQTTSELKVRLQADGLRWVIGVEAVGDIKTKTVTQKGSATFENAATATFETDKQILISPSGIQFSDTNAAVTSDTELLEFKTDYDSSLLSGLARNMAKKQYRQKKDQAAEELENRVRTQATVTLDDKVTTGVSKVDGQFNDRWLEPMRQLQLSPVATQLRTTKDQLVVDYRLAGVDQLAAYGYRPEIIGDSLVSIQVHESAMNNLLHKLALDGTSGKLRDVMSTVAEQLGFTDYEVPTEVSEKVTVKLITRDAIRIRFYNGRVQLLLQFKELRNNNIVWKNFAVLVEFFPQLDSINGNLKREGVLQIIGRSLRLGDRIALQTIFNKVIPSTRSMSLLGSSIAEHPNFEDTRIGTFQVQHGWLTYCVAPEPRIAVTSE
tara:strand:- start:267 stop:2894 length:2628 start_codon:yes stop_codon:yes gene_type:complete